MSESHCHPSNCSAGIIAIAITGTASTADVIKRCRKAFVGSSEDTSVTSAVRDVAPCPPLCFAVGIRAE